VANATGHTGVAVGANGAVTYDLHTETVLTEHQLSPEQLEQVTGLLRAAIPQVRFGMEYGTDFAYEPGYRHDWELAPAADGSGRPLPSVRSAELPELLGKPVVKLLAGGLVTVTRSGHSPLVEISPLGVTKASGLAELAGSLGVDRQQVAAIGDMPNDVPMLTWAGRSYAVANAHPSARQAADEVLAESNDEDAVAKLIWRLLGR